MAVNPLLSESRVGLDSHDQISTRQPEIGEAGVAEDRLTLGNLGFAVEHSVTWDEAAQRRLGEVVGEWLLRREGK